MRRQWSFRRAVAAATAGSLVGCFASGLLMAHSEQLTGGAFLHRALAWGGGMAAWAVPYGWALACLFGLARLFHQPEPAAGLQRGLWRALQALARLLARTWRAWVGASVVLVILFAVALNAPGRPGHVPSVWGLVGTTAFIYSTIAAAILGAWGNALARGDRAQPGQGGQPNGRADC